MVVIDKTSQNKQTFSGMKLIVRMQKKFAFGYILVCVGEGNREGKGRERGA